MTTPNALDALTPEEREQRIRYSNSHVIQPDTQIAFLLTRLDEARQHALASESALREAAIHVPDPSDGYCDSCGDTLELIEINGARVWNHKPHCWFAKLRAALALPSGQPALVQMLKEAEEKGKECEWCDGLAIMCAHCIQQREDAHERALAALKAEVRREVAVPLIEAIEECTLVLAEVHLRFPYLRLQDDANVSFGQLAQMYEATAKEARAALAAPPAVTQRTEAEIRREEAQWWADEQVEKDGELSARGAIRLAEIDAAAPPAVTRDKDEK